MNQQDRNGLEDVNDTALADMRAENGGALKPNDVNLAELARRAGITRSRARTIKAHGFKVLPHGRTGSKAATTLLAPCVADSRARWPGSSRSSAADNPVVGGGQPRCRREGGEACARMTAF